MLGTTCPSLIQPEILVNALYIELKKKIRSVNIHNQCASKTLCVFPKVTEIFGSAFSVKKKIHQCC